MLKRLIQDASLKTSKTLAVGIAVVAAITATSAYAVVNSKNAMIKIPSGTQSVWSPISGCHSGSSVTSAANGWYSAKESVSVGKYYKYSAFSSSNCTNNLLRQNGGTVPADNLTNWWLTL